ncbi:hypothetical protein [uncultured Alistipes sp.]|uniref:hypothetical protein n=1 Tax=uncultured Alistipes sp. TaxID=538949 RepID=UPI0025CECF8E|nr:hypothetical protein [uncultured Alistipes sp.]
MKQAHKKRPPRATAFCIPVLLDMGGLYKSDKYINEVNYLDIPESTPDTLTYRYYSSTLIQLVP